MADVACFCSSYRPEPGAGSRAASGRPARDQRRVGVGRIFPNEVPRIDDSKLALGQPLMERHDGVSRAVRFASARTSWRPLAPGSWQAQRMRYGPSSEVFRRPCLPSREATPSQRRTRKFAESRLIVSAEPPQVREAMAQRHGRHVGLFVRAADLGVNRRRSQPRIPSIVAVIARIDVAPEQVSGEATLSRQRGSCHVLARHDRGRRNSCV
jgi:hypothetical protein